jgi:7-cyano-7-deazaguanine reductase
VLHGVAIDVQGILLDSASECFVASSTQRGTIVCGPGSAGRGLAVVVPARFAARMPMPPPKAYDPSLLETFPNPNAARDYVIHFECPEFTCVCPRTGQPDFATIEIEYVPAASCVELKSLKLYLWSFRDVGAFHEKVTNDICDDLVKLMQPRRLTVVSRFKVRGGITTTVTCRHDGG